MKMKNCLFLSIGVLLSSTSIFAENSIIFKTLYYKTEKGVKGVNDNDAVALWLYESAPSNGDVTINNGASSGTVRPVTMNNFKTPFLKVGNHYNCSVINHVGGVTINNDPSSFPIDFDCVVVGQVSPRKVQVDLLSASGINPLPKGTVATFISGQLIS